MQVLLRRSNASWLLLGALIFGLGVFGFAIGALMLPPSEVLGDRLAELTCLQVAFTPDRYKDVFLSFPQEMRVAVTQLLYPGDMVFAWGYGFQLFGLTGLLAMRLPGKWFAVGAVVMWAPLLASALDVTEDIFLYTIASRLVENPEAVIAPALTLFAGIAATLKYFALTVVTPVYGFAGIAKGLTVDRKALSLLLYAFLGLNLFMMIMRPLQQVPPCF